VLKPLVYPVKVDGRLVGPKSNSIVINNSHITGCTFKVWYNKVISFCNVNSLCAGSSGMSADASIPLVGCGEHYAPLAPWSIVVDQYHVEKNIIGLCGIEFFYVILINFLILLTFMFSKKYRIFAVQCRLSRVHNRILLLVLRHFAACIVIVILVRKFNTILQEYHENSITFYKSTTKMQHHFTRVPRKFNTILQEYYENSTPFYKSTTKIQHHFTGVPQKFNTILQEYHENSTPFYKSTTKIQHNFTRVPRKFNTILQEYHENSTPFYKSTTKIQHHFSRVPRKFNTSLQEYHENSTPLYKSTTKIEHHFTRAPRKLNTILQERHEN